MLRLRAALDGALGGHGRLVLIAGEPGIGKTRLAEVCVAEAEACGALVFWGRCWEGDGAPAFWPWIEVLRGVVGASDPKELQAGLASGAAEIATLLPEVARLIPDLPPLPPADPEQTRFRLFDAVASFLCRTAERRPLVIVLDDLHWADQSSLLLLQFLMRSLPAAHLLVLGTYRDVALERQHPLAETLADLRRGPAHERLQLRGLAPDETAALVSASADGDLGPGGGALIALIQEQTEGNPFFIRETLRLLMETGRLGRTGNARTASADSIAELGVAEGVREVIGRRLARLSSDANDLLTVAAVIGRFFTMRELEAASGRDGSPLTVPLEEAEAARLIEAAPEARGRYRFSHALIRETLYHDILTVRRVALHRRVGEALESLYAGDTEPHLSELAYHFLEAAPNGDPGKAVDYSRRAAEHAARLSAFEEAVQHYRRALLALKLCSPGNEALRCDLLLALGDQGGEAGNSAVRWATYSLVAGIARGLNLSEHLARAALGLGEYPLPEFPSVALQQVAVLEAALLAVGAADSLLRAKVLAILAENIQQSPSPERAGELSREAVAVAQRTGDPATLAFALNSRHIVLDWSNEVADLLPIAGEILALAEQIGDDWLNWKAHRWLFLDLFRSGDIAGADGELAWLGEITERQRRFGWKVPVSGWRAMRTLLRGDVAESQRLYYGPVAEGWSIWNPASRLFVARTLRQFSFLVARLKGRLPQLEEELISEYTLAIGTRWPHAAGARLALLYLEAGRRDDARRLFDQLAANDFVDVSRDATWLNTLILLAELSARLGVERRCAMVERLLRPLAGRVALDGYNCICLGPVDHYLGLLVAGTGRWDDAERRFTAALALNERMQAPINLALTQQEYARMLLARGGNGDLPHARELLEAARATYAALDLDYQAGTVQALLAGPRLAGRRAASPTYPDGLSEREVEVLRLIAAGKRNPEIATALVISRYTVERHVNHILAKTGAANRVEAANYAHARGLAAN
jgi:DNA-binding NarL/FixJ family response regulator